MSRVLVTGAHGNIGRQVVAALVNDPDVSCVVATDLRPPAAPRPGVIYAEADIRDDTLATLFRQHQIDAVVHLAAIVTPPPGASREFLYDVDVNGTENVLQCALEAGVTRFVYTSSGAAYGYWADNAPLLTEAHPLRGNEAFAYSHHKRLVEELLARWRQEHPELTQVIFRVSTVLGRDLHNDITKLFERKVVIGIRDVEAPFCFVWDEDAAAALVQAVHSDRPGIYNLTGDGVMTLREVASALGRRYVSLPPALLHKALGVLHARKWVPWGPEQMLFLRYRPVLDNTALKSTFGYTPRSSRSAFSAFLRARA